MEVLLKDAELSKDDVYLTIIYAFWVDMLDKLKDKHEAPDRVNFIKLLYIISEQGAAFEEDTCAIIESLVTKDEKDAAIQWLSSLVKNSKYPLQKNTISELSKITCNDELTYDTRLSSFKAIVYCLKNNRQWFDLNIRKTIDYVLEENDEKMTKYALTGMSFIPSEDLTERNIEFLSRIKTYSDKQTLRQIQILEAYSVTNCESLPEMSYNLLHKESCLNKNEKIREAASQLLNNAIQEGRPLPAEIYNQIAFEFVWKDLQRNTDPAAIKKMLETWCKTDFKELLFSEDFSTTIIALLRAPNNQGYLSCIFKLLEKILEQNLSFTNKFIEEYIQLTEVYSSNQAFVRILEKLIARFDQWETKHLLDFAIHGMENDTEEVKHAWWNIMLILSKRNISFIEEQIVKLIEVTFSNHDPIMFEVLQSILDGQEEVSTIVGDRILKLIKNKQSTDEALKLLVLITKNGFTLPEEFVLKLSALNSKHPELSTLVSQILLNLSNNGVVLPEELKSKSNLMKKFKILQDTTETYERKYEAIREVHHDMKCSPNLPENWIDSLWYNIEKHLDSKLSQKWYKAVVKACWAHSQLLRAVNWRSIVLGVNHEKLKRHVLLLFEMASQASITFSPGILAKFSKGEDKTAIVEILETIKDYQGDFAKEDHCWEQLIRIYNRKTIESREDLNDYLEGKTTSFLYL